MSGLMSGLNVLVPLGGRNSRFSNNGYLLPAPLVRVCGKEIILWTLSKIRLTHDDELIIIFDPSFIRKHLLEGIILEHFPRAKFAYLTTATRGPIETLLTGLNTLSAEKRDRPTMCMDGDGYFQFDATSLYRDLAKTGMGGVVSYKDLQPKPMYSYVKVEAKEKSITAIAEKKKISDFANTGTYFFPSGNQLKKYIATIVEKYNDKTTTKYELYTSNVISEMLSDGVKFKMLECPSEQFASLGSPELIKKFSKKRISQTNFIKKRFCFDLENTLVTRPSVPGDFSTCKPIESNVRFVRSLSNMGHTIIVQSTAAAGIMKSGEVFHAIIQMLEDLNIPHDDVHFGKPKADFYIDDEAVYSGHDLSKELGFYDVDDMVKASETAKRNDTKQNKKVALAQHMRKCTIGNEEVYMNASTGLPIFRVKKINTYFLFDLDGTMVATDPVYLKVFDEILKPYGHTVDKKFFEERIHGRVDDQIFEDLLPKTLTQQDRDRVQAEKDSLFRKVLFSNEDKLLNMMGGLNTFIDWAESHGIRSACVTNCPRGTAEAILSALDLRRRMEFLVIGAECTRAKPFPDPYTTAMSRLGARPEECIIFEDSRSGIMSAVASKARLIVGIRSSLNDHVLVRHGANVTVQDFTEVTPGLFNQLHSSLLSPKVETRILEALRKNEFPVKSISSARQLPGGNISQCLRVVLRYANDGEDIPFPKSMILKMEHENKTNDMVKTLQLYSREWTFYEGVSRQVATRVPRVYAIVRDEKGLPFGVMMEDLQSIESAVCKTVLTTKDGKTVVAELARLHAQFWNRTPHSIKKINDPSFKGIADKMQNRWSVFAAKWENKLFEDAVSNGEIILHHLPWIQDRLSQPPFTLCHGDVSRSNIFFLKVMEEVPAFVDWQYVSASKGISDLAFFILSSFPIKEHAQLEHQLIEVYHRALRLNGIYGYSLKQCWHDYRLSLMMIPFVVSVWYGSSPLSEMVNPDFPATITNATFKAIKRHHSVSLLPEYFSMNLTRRCRKGLRKRGYPVQNVIVDAKKLKGGYICETLRLRIEYEHGVDVSDTDKYPKTCVLKAEAPESSDHQTALNLHLYDREWHFYKVMADKVPVRCPKFYGEVCGEDAKGGTVGVLMEDLCLPGAVLCPRLDQQGVESLVESAAVLHAKFWNDKELKTLGVHPLNGPWFQPSWESKIIGHWPEFKKKWAGVLSTAQLDMGEKIVRNFRFIQNHLASPPFTFLHGDVKPANMFMLKDGTPAFIDWQYTKIGKGVCDVVFFLIEGYPEAKQREMESKMIIHYHKCLEKHGVVGYTLDMVKRDWAIACMYFPIYVSFWFGTVKDEDLVDEMFPRRIVPRTFDAIARNNSVSYLPE